MKKQCPTPLWFVAASLADSRVPALVPSLAWIAESTDVLLEAYLESSRSGALFAQTGSTVLGGHHHQQFNYLAARTEIEVLDWTKPSLLASSFRAFGLKAWESETLSHVYQCALAKVEGTATPPVVFIPSAPAEAGKDVRPYLYPEIFFRRAVAFPANAAADAIDFIKITGAKIVGGLFLSAEEEVTLAQAGLEVPCIEAWQGRSIGEVTLALARRWKAQAHGVAFGDPDAILAQVASLCREHRVAVFGPRNAAHQVVYSAYTEDRSTIAEETAELACAIGNRVLVGRQTCDGDLFTWSRQGVAMEIVDPNRPAFPVVRELEHPWQARDSGVFDLEPEDAQLELWADEGRVLASLNFHSGEMAHNEAMVNLVELAILNGFKFGMSVQAARYESCPQFWELLATPRDQGGALGLVEPLLHAGGLGVLAERHAPVGVVRDQCLSAMERIRCIAGEAATPRGYQAFMDVELDGLDSLRPSLYDELEAAGLEYSVSSYRPGRNRLAHLSKGHISLNQTSLSMCPASPFVRMSSVEDIRYHSLLTRPGWFIGTLDAPVIAFNPHIWEDGSRLLSMIRLIQSRAHWVNTTPRVIARYARILKQRGLLPPMVDIPA